MLDREALKKAIHECDADAVMSLTIDASNELRHTWEDGNMDAICHELQMLIQQMGIIKRDFTPNKSDMIIWELGKLEGYVAGVRYMYEKKCQLNYVHEGISHKNAIKILECLSKHTDLVLHSDLASELEIEYNELTVLMRPFIREQFVNWYGRGKHCRYIISSKGKNYLRELMEDKDKEDKHNDES